MNEREFWAAIVDSLAWPVATVCIAILLRRVVRSALEGQIKRLKAGPSGVEVEYWEQATAEVREHLPEDTAPAERIAGSLEKGLARVANEEPAAAILEAYAQVERELTRLIEADVSKDDLRNMGVLQLADAAHRHGRISERSLAAIRGLSVMRNLAAHGKAEGLDPDRALEFVHLAEAVLFSLGSYRKHDPVGPQ